VTGADEQKGAKIAKGQSAKSVVSTIITLLPLLPSVPFFDSEQGVAVRLLTCLAASVFLFSTTSLAADNWPQWRGPAGDGVAAEAKHPEQWSADEHVAWKV